MLPLHRTQALRPALVFALALVLGPALASVAHAEPLARLKRIEAQRLMAEPMQERRERKERVRELRAMAREMKRLHRTSLTQHGHNAKPVFDDEDLRAGRALPARTRSAEPLAAEGPPSPNKRVNNPAGDAAGDGQCETSLVAFGNKLVAAWNDGKGFHDGTNNTQGYATSTDGGNTWTDQGVFPTSAGFPNLVWTSDPVLAVNTATGAFYFSALCDPTNAGTLSGIAVVKGRFTGSAFAWGVPSVVRQVNESTDFLDKQWLAVDPANGKVVLSYTWFPSSGDEIDVQTADSSLTAWTAFQRISTPGENGLTQGSRPIIGPGGVIYIMYYLIGSIDTDSYRIAKSTNGGTSFGAPNTIVSFYSNYGTGAPAFNRPTGINFASIAVERSSGLHSGRLFLTWAEGLNWYDDEPTIGGGGNVSEGSDTLATANDSPANATPFTLGKTLEGRMGSGSDLDYWSVSLTAGQSILCECDSTTSSLTVTLRMFAGDGVTRLAYTTGNQNAPGVWLFTAPTTGTYYVRLANFNGSGTGTYRVRTGPAANTGERGRDQRDVFTSFSDNQGTSWSAPVRVNTDAIGYDDWLPEIAVAADPTNPIQGDRVYVTWYDFRDAAPATDGGESNIYLARSDDGGTSWNQLGPTTDAKSSWTSVNSNIQPNQGDYQSLWADSTQLIACWSDGRDVDPNVYMSRWTLAATPTQLALVSATATPGQVALQWYTAASPGLAVTVYREPEGGTWSVLGTITPDAEGQLAWVDTSVQPGQTYDYRLGVTENGLERFYGQTTVTVPSALAFALETARPNPAGADAQISFTLPSAEPATLSLIDIAGRAILTRDVGGLGAGRHTLPLAAGSNLRPGVYLVRLDQHGRSLTTRVSIVR